MINLLHGNDEFSSNQFLKGIVEQKNISEFDLNVVDTNDLTENKFKENICTISLFGTNRLIIFNYLLSKINSTKEKNWENFIDILLNKPSTNEVIFFEKEEINLKKNYFAKLNDICQITLSNIPSGRGSWDLNRKWIIERQKKYNLNISNEGINKLVELLGSNYRYIDNELQKLSNYNPDGNIVIDDIEIMVSGIKEDSIFELIDSIMVKDNLKASKILDNLIEQGNSFFNIINMIARQFRLILITKDLLKMKIDYSDIKRQIQISSDYAFNKIIAQSKETDEVRLKNSLRLLLDIDVDIKSGYKSEKEYIKKLIFLL
ncbi:MAG: DNA polymerase III subunit delta [Chloroflexi bacterium]|nr:DNA polymerase III subunit delta [Chloroflexota bacterium]